MSLKPSIPKGTRDFSSDEILRREYITDTIKTIFKLYGYEPIETPAIENLSTLLGKYGEEGDRLIFRILNSGDFLASSADEDLRKRDISKLSSQLCEKGLRYDLTVPFARYVVQHRDEIVFPFRRYQIQPVWRADRPQKGRYREFLQCDADVIGSDSLLNEIELLQVINNIFSNLNIKVQIKINNRKIIEGIAEFAGAPNRVVDVSTALDKYEKNGWANVKNELETKGINAGVIEEFRKIIQVFGFNSWEKLKFLKSILSDSQIGLKGIEEIDFIINKTEKLNLRSEIIFDLTLARGLNYYTGTIIEVKSADVSIGSICGGGRYDNLTGVFGLEGVSGVGVSFGADRIYDVMNQLGLFGSVESSSTRVLVLNFGDAEVSYALKIVEALRDRGIRSELYPDNARIKKQMSYADSRKIPYIIMAGGDEIKNTELTIKNMLSGEQKKILMQDLSFFNFS
ncbi:MAG: histidine--tRNA ligase [Bacteroidota bacterium]